MSDQTAPAPAKDAKPEEPKLGRVREGLTEAQILAQKAKLTVEEAPEGWIKLSEVADAVKAAEIPVSKLVRATGGDRAMNPPADPVFQVKFVGRTRYLAGEVMTKGMALLKNPDFLRTRRARKTKDGEAAAKKKTTTVKAKEA